MASNQQYPESRDPEQRRLTDPREFENNQRLAQNVVSIDPATVMAIIIVALLLPLLLTGFFAT